LKSGSMYYADVVAINGAGRHGDYKTESAMLDANKPTVTQVTVGTQEVLESAELVVSQACPTSPGCVQISDDADGIPTHWTAVDDASGMVEYKVVVRQVGGAEVSATTIPLEIETNPDHHLDTIRNDQANAYVPVTGLQIGKQYEVCVTAVDGAAWNSVMKCSNPIEIVAADVIGDVLEGAEAGVDVDSQSELSVLTLNWHSFASALCGIVSYEFAVGYGPYGAELRGFSDYGINLIDEGSGIAQVALPLAAGDLVFVTLRGVTGCGNFLEATSDGILIDGSAPKVQSVKLGAVTTATDSTRLPAYQSDRDTASASWDA
jgi:hypothetical protein